MDFLDKYSHSQNEKNINLDHDPSTTQNKQRRNLKTLQKGDRDTAASTLRNTTRFKAVFFYSVFLHSPNKKDKCSKLRGTSVHDSIDG